MTTIAQAKNDISEAFYNAWKADSLSKNIIVFFDKKDVDEDDKSADQSWARFTIKHFDSQFSKQSLASSSGEKSYQRDGVVTVGIFTPIGEGVDLDSALASIVVNAFEGIDTPNGVWFRNVRFNEVGVSGAWFQTNVKANFNYSEHK
jgi:hypothetical protein